MQAPSWFSFSTRPRRQPLRFRCFIGTTSASLTTCRPAGAVLSQARKRALSDAGPRNLSVPIGFQVEFLAMSTGSLLVKDWLTAALLQAEKSWNEGGIPIGSVLVDSSGTVVAAGHNERVQTGDPTAHAEMVAMRRAGRRRDWRDLTLVSTLSPCAMCSGTAVLYRIPARDHRRESDVPGRGRVDEDATESKSTSSTTSAPSPGWSG